MPRKRSAALTDGELRIMSILWDRGRGTVGDVVAGITGPRRPAYNTVLTMMRILERKGYVTHEKEGRAFVYIPVIDRTQARRRALSSLLERFFDGSPELLLVNLLAHERVDAAELERVRGMIEAAAEPGQPAPGDRGTPATGVITAFDRHRGPQLSVRAGSRRRAGSAER